MDSDELEAMKNQLHCCLSHQAISEYELLELLKSQGFFAFLSTRPAPVHTLFCAHFLLFHALYQLRDQLWLQQSADLHISPLAIQLRPFTEGGAELCNVDLLREYYLDLENLRSTNADDVDELIRSFWQKFSRQTRNAEALVVLGLQEPVSDEQIRQHYKKRVMQCHPDRGGDVQQLKRLNQAMGLLGL